MSKPLMIQRNEGFTLIELMIVTCIIGTLAAIAVPAYLNYRQKALITRCTIEMKTIEREVVQYYLHRGVYPADLDDIGLENILDPWGRPFQYWPIIVEKNGKIRGTLFRQSGPDKPITNDFDLFSMGTDGQYKLNIRVPSSRDDIIRANDGRYLGIASEY